jgi:uncharacterized protein YecA (UPF0149 family)
MPIGAEVHPRFAVSRDNHQPVEQRTVLDKRLELVLRDMAIDELRRLQETLYELIADGSFSIAQIAETVEDQSNAVAAWLHFRDTRDEAVKVAMLLGALAVAIAWLTYRAKPAPTRSIQQVIESVDDGHPYLLPIPRSDPCFCGSGSKFKSCHGRPPNAAPAVSARRNDETAPPP